MSKIKPINVFSALQKSSYLQANQEMIMSMLFDYFNSELSEVYLRKVEEFHSKEKVYIFVIKHIIMTKYENKSIPITILIYIPSSFPTTAPEFYFYRTGNVKINEELIPQYVEPYSMKIHFENDITWKNNLWSLQSILVWLDGLFQRHFPLFKVNYEVKNDIVCSLGSSNIEKVVFEGEFEEQSPQNVPPKLTEEKVCELLRKEILAKLKPIIKQEVELIQKNKSLLSNTIKQYTTQEKTFPNLKLNQTVVDKAAKLQKEYEDEIEKEREVLEKQSSKGKNQTIIDIEDSLIKINEPNKKYLSYIVRKQNAEHYISQLKSLLKKKVVSFKDMYPETKDSVLIREFRRSYKDIYVITQRIKEMKLDK